MKLINKFVDLNSQSFQVRIVYEYVVLFDIICMFSTNRFNNFQENTNNTTKKMISK